MIVTLGLKMSLEKNDRQDSLFDLISAPPGIRASQERSFCVVVKEAVRRWEKP